MDGHAKFKESLTALLNEAVITKYRDPKDRRHYLYADSRSTLDDKGYFTVHPVGFDICHVFIVCPHCGEIHTHGIAPGHRVSHCISSIKNNGYCISLDNEVTYNG